MKVKQAFFKRIIAVLFCVTCVMGIAFTAQADITITDPTESEDLYFYQKPFGDSGLDFVCPLPYSRCGMATEEEGFLQMVILKETGDEEPYYIISGIKQEGLTEADLEGMNTVDFIRIFSRIVNAMGGMHTEYLEDYNEKHPAVRVTFAEDDLYGRHVVGVRDGWLLVLSLFPGSKEMDLNGLDRYTDFIFGYMVEPYISLPKVDTIELPDSSLVLSLPEGMQATVDRYDEYTDEEMVVYLIHPAPPEDNAAILTLTTVRNDAYKGARMQEMTVDDLNEMASRFLYGAEHVESNWLFSDSEYPVLFLSETGTGMSVYHMITIKEDWLLCFTLLDVDRWPLDETLTMQANFLSAMLEGEGKVPSLTPDVFSYSTLNGSFQMALPYGYSFQQKTQDDGTTKCFIFSILRANSIYTASFRNDESYVGEDISSRLDELQKYALNAEQSLGESVTVQQVEDGLLGLPNIQLSTETHSFAVSFLMKDGCLASFGFQAIEGAATQEAIDLLPEMISFKETP